MTVQELNTLHIICELERAQLLTILAMSVKNQLVGFLLTGNRSNFLYVEGSTAWLYVVPISFRLYTEQMNALIEFPYTIVKLLCM